MAKLLLIFRVVIEGHIMMIALVICLSLFSITISVAIAKPGLIEGSSVIPRNERAELCYGNLQLGENSFQPWFDGSRYIWPISWQWIKARESFKNCAAEFCRSGAPSVQFPNVEQRPTSQQCSKNIDKNLNWYSKDLQWVPLAGLIPIIIFLIDSLYRMAHHSEENNGEP